MTGPPSGVTRFGEHVLHEVAMRDLVSTTYRATAVDRSTPSTAAHLVALRVIGDGLAAAPEAVDGFLQANDRVSAVDHPHVLRVLDVGRHSSQAYVASVWRDGVPIDHLLAGQAPLPTWVVQRLGGQLAEALDALHSNDIVHGTIGIRSVWIKSRRRGQPSSSAAMTAFGTRYLLGDVLRNAGDADAASDLFCVAPEQVRDGRAGASSDQYGLACLLYMALTGAPPFTAATNKAMFRAHLSAAPPPVTSMRPDLHNAWDEVFNRALDKDPLARFENCRTLVRAAGRCPTPDAERRHAPAPSVWAPGQVAAAGGSAAGPAPERSAGEPGAPAPRPWARRILIAGMVIAVIMVLMLLLAREWAPAVGAAGPPDSQWARGVLAGTLR